MAGTSAEVTRHNPNLFAVGEGNCDTQGKERPDLLAEEECTTSQPNQPLICFKITTATAEFATDAWKSAAVGKRWQRFTTPNNLPLDIAMGSSRMAREHEYLQRHRIGAVDYPTLLLYSPGETTSEYLDVCSGLEDTIRQQDTLEEQAQFYRTARRQMVDLPKTTVG